MPPVDAEVCIGGDHHWIGQGLAQAHEAGVGQAHGHAGVLGTQVEHLEQFIREIQGKPQMALAQKLVEGAQVRFVQQKQRLRHG